MKKLYVLGASLEEIAAVCGVRPATVSGRKAKDGDWDRSRLDNLVSQAAVGVRRNAFLVTLFDFFEQDLAGLRGATDPAERLELLRAYVRNFTSLVEATRQAEPGVEAAEVAAATLRGLAGLALAKDRREVVEFIHSHMDEVAAVIRRDLAPLAS